MADDWHTATFRQCVLSKIEEAVRQSGQTTTRSCHEMENHVFQKAKTKEEYLGYTARLILHIREMTRQGSSNNQMEGGTAQHGQTNEPQQMASLATDIKSLSLEPSNPTVNMQDSITENMPETMQETIESHPI